MLAGTPQIGSPAEPVNETDINDEVVVPHLGAALNNPINLPGPFIAAIPPISIVISLLTLAFLANVVVAFCASVSKLAVEGPVGLFLITNVVSKNASGVVLAVAAVAAAAAAVTGANCGD